MLVPAPQCAQRQVTSLGEQLAVISAEVQRRARYIKLQAAVAGLGEETINEDGWILRLGITQASLQKFEAIVVYWPAIVGIGKAEVPDLAALIKVGQAGRGDL